MKPYKVEIASEMAKDIKKLRLSKTQIEKLKEKINDIAEKPWPKTEGGYGEPLSVKDTKELFLKFRFQDHYRVVYALIREKHTMRVLIIGLRKDKEVYTDMLRRI